ncbi:MAG: hypothetical protein PHV13_04810 [Candidatus ainarchaeum sp.]|nr:hypothetical protein [Candidatus ainarchaeum sp.]
MTLRDFAYSLVFGKPLVLWLGILTITLLISTASIMVLNTHTRIRIPVAWHHRFAFATICSAVVHATLALSLYF